MAEEEAFFFEKQTIKTFGGNFLFFVFYRLCTTLALVRGEDSGFRRKKTVNDDA